MEDARLAHGIALTLTRPELSPAEAVVPHRHAVKARIGDVLRLVMPYAA